jgi:hypothetical protein
VKLFPNYFFLAREKRLNLIAGYPEAGKVPMKFPASPGVEYLP